MIVRLVTVLLGAILTAVPPAVEPSIALKIPAFPSASFDNYAAVLLPDVRLETIELHIVDVLASIQTSTVRVTLNEVPMTPFVAINPMPTGVRVIVRLGMTMSPEYAVRRGGESILTVEARDVNSTLYRGQFYLTVDPSKSRPELAKSTRARAQQSSTVAPPEFRAPAIRITSPVPAPSVDRAYQLEAEITDTEGLRRIVVELNGSDVEEVILQNEQPIRYRGGKIAKGATLGEATGDGNRVVIKLPLRLARDRINVLAVRAENVRGLSTRRDQAIEVLK